MLLCLAYWLYAMTTPRPVYTGRDICYDSASDLSSLTPKDPDVVPIGTVAARIMELHNLSKVSTFNGSPLPISHHPENSRIGFGRRVDSRFGKPASRSCKPDGDTQEDTKHSFLGLNTRRSNHMEAHAFVDARAKWNRTAGLRQRLQPSGLEGVVQDQATISSDILPNRDFRRESPSVYNEKESERITDSHRKRCLNIIPPKLSLPNLPQYVTQQVSIKQEAPLKASFQESRQCQSTDQQKLSANIELQSSEKAFTLRRQSLRDLYYSYGMHSPIGLVMSQKVTFGLEDTPRSSSRHEFCQACSCAIAVRAMNCTSGVSLCEKCQSLSPAAMTTSDGSDESMENKNKCRGEHWQKEKSTSQLLDNITPKGSSCEQPSSLLRCTPDRGGLRHLDEKERSPHIRVESNGNAQKLPLLRFEEATPCCESLKSSRKDTQLPDSSQAHQQTVPAKALHSAKDITSVSKIDTILSTRAPNIVTISTQLSSIDTQSLHQGHHQRQGDRRSKRPHSNPSSRDERGSGNDSSGSSGCAEVNQGVLQHRQGITCGRKRRRYPEETDSGYIAGTSHLEETEMPQQDINQYHTRGYGNPGYYMTSKQCLSQNQNTLTPLVGEIKATEDKQLIHHISYAKHTTQSPSIVTRAESVPQSQCHQLLPTIQRRTPANEAASWTLDTPQSRGPKEKEDKDQHDAKVIDNSRVSKWRESEHRILPCAGGEVHTTDHANNENTNSQQYFMPRTASPILGNVKSALMRLESPSKSELSGLMITDLSVETCMEKDSPDRLINSTIGPSHDTADQKMSTSKLQSKLGSQESLRGITRESFADLPLDLSANTNGVSGTNFNSFTDAVTQDSLDISAPTPGTAAEADPLSPYVNLRSDMMTDMARCIPFHTPGDLSPNKFRPTSRRLSAFFKLQEQNVVSILNKRLQDHQEALKRAEMACNNQVSNRITAEIQSQSQGCEQNHQSVIERNASRLGKTVEIYELNLTDPASLLGQQGAEVDRREKEGHEEAQNSSFKLTHMIDKGEEHDCAWKQIAMKVSNRAAQNPNLCSENNTTPVRENAGDVGIKGITIVIHLEGRESVVIKADLSQGI